MKNRRALILSGGGARGAYQAGVLLGMADLIKEMSLRKPFPILVGISAGAVNAAYLAAHADDIPEAIDQLAGIWRTMHSQQVFRTDLPSLGHIGMAWTVGLLTSGAFLKGHPRALLDTSPFSDLIRRHIAFEKIGENIKNGSLDAMAVSATDYESNANMTFFDARENVPSWLRMRRLGVRQSCEASHVLASAAIPLFFPPVALGRRYYGDGCLRNMAPLSPALHLGADRILAIGVRHPTPLDFDMLNLASNNPSIARILSVVINAVMMDGIEADIERLQRINVTVSRLSEEAQDLSPLRQVDCLYIHPSQDIAEIAFEESSSIPRVLRFLLGSLGNLKEASELSSYLMFEPNYTRRLIELGVSDARMQRRALQAFFTA